MLRVRRALSLKRLGVLAQVVVLSPLAITGLPVNAAPPPAVFKDSAGSIYIHSGVNAGDSEAQRPKGDRLEVELIGQPFKKKLRAGACGQITFGPSATMPSIGNSVTINGATIDLTNISAASPVPKCTNGTFSPVPTSNFKTSKGKVTLVGYTAGQSYNVLFDDVGNHFNTTVNRCAFAVIKSTANHPLTAQIKINGTAYNVSSLITAEPPICRKKGTTVSLYTPSSW